jgi:hypothetical protein
MRRLGTQIAALSATNAWSYRPGDRRVMRAESGCLSEHIQQPGFRLSKSD